ncbi:MAG: Acetylornithine aminotransferase [Paracidovorax wautersii]|uniref:Acetylornithine aminotransferase n=1 Tax=Paracidovorax wautersii TaxID=1177982 RepID=A0A7V8FP39_9BURK|nr:MAG: Acetylornithine aminotransferase [Paracidovorax wautersii]
MTTPPLEAASPHVMPTYGRLPIAFERGEGVWLWDVNGKKYLDSLAGVAVNTLGHAHPEFVAALREQVGRLIHTSNYFHVTLQEQLAARLTALSGLTNAFFCSTGLEANEAMIKIARKFGHDKGITRPKIVVYEHAFHGRSLATLSATGNPKVQAGFGPLVEGFVRVPINDIAAIKQITQDDPDVVAVMFEVIQGEGGIHEMQAQYLRELRALCDERGWLMLIDEVQTGIARTGKWFGFQWAGIQPDVISLAKGLGSGVPVGAVLAGPAAAGVFKPGNHGSTFGGNPLAMRAGVETLRIIEQSGLLANASAIGEHIRTRVRQELEGTAGFVEVRGQGLLIGIELAHSCGDLMGLAAEAGLLLSVTADRVVRLVPPLIITQAEADQLVGILVPLIQRFLAAKSA